MDAGETVTKMETEANETVKPKIKYDWYQTETHVIVTILAKNTENVKVNCGEKVLFVSAKLPSGSEYNLKLDLADFINTEQCSYQVRPSKIEIKLKKRRDDRWTILEKDQSNSTEIFQTHPSSNKKPKDWEKLAKEITKDEAVAQSQGESAVNALFQNIYGAGNDEVKRAMNKSFIESGGTVLSTNWEEVGQKPVNKRPPDGMEWKSWDS